jgi:hypothetical protein
MEMATDRTPETVYRFGNASAPKAPRHDQDFGLPADSDIVGPGELPLPKGASTYTDPNQAPLTRHYHSIEKGTVLPEGLAIVRDDGIAVSGSSRPTGHHTIYPTRAMPFVEFVSKFMSLPWKYAGKKLE